MLFDPMRVLDKWVVKNVGLLMRDSGCRHSSNSYFCQYYTPPCGVIEPCLATKPCVCIPVLDGVPAI